MKSENDTDSPLQGAHRDTILITTHNKEEYILESQGNATPGRPNPNLNPDREWLHIYAGPFNFDVTGPAVPSSHLPLVVPRMAAPKSGAGRPDAPVPLTATC